MKSNERIRRFCLLALSACFVLVAAQTASAQQTPAPGTFLISEFRASGAGALLGDQIRDEYVELYNNTDTMQDLQGYYLQFSDGANDFVIGPLGFSFPVAPHAHVLFANAPGYTLNGYAAPDFDVASGDTTVDIFTENQGVALFFGDPVGASTRIDAVGFAGNSTTYREGTGLPVFSGGGFTPPGVQYAWVRKLTTGLPQDTDDNAQDFALVSLSGDMLGGVQSTLGAPGPENSASPIQHNAQIKSSLIDPQCPGGGPATSACARVRDPNAAGANAAQGTLDLRRTFTNSTGQTITRLRFRLVNITTQGNRAAGEADLRALDGSDIMLTRTDTNPITARGLTVETPPTPTNGGGLNTSLVPTVSAPITSGASLPVHFLIGVQQGGNYRYFVNIEAATTMTKNHVSSNSKQTGAHVSPPLAPVSLKRWVLRGPNKLERSK
ncbi:MAG: hypothetical protein DMF64_21805 [Acidobacteria bacterium]|nr:MAG: hypothetical protein DMF64_21805 [Acidobacteriota bacterium]